MSKANVKLCACDDRLCEDCFEGNEKSLRSSRESDNRGTRLCTRYGKTSTERKQSSANKKKSLPDVILIKVILTTVAASHKYVLVACVINFLLTRCHCSRLRLFNLGEMSCFNQHNAVQ